MSWGDGRQPRRGALANLPIAPERDDSCVLASDRFQLVGEFVGNGQECSPNFGHVALGRRRGPRGRDVGADEFDRGSIVRSEIERGDSLEQGLNQCNGGWVAIPHSPMIVGSDQVWPEESMPKLVTRQRIHSVFKLWVRQCMLADGDPAFSASTPPATTAITAIVAARVASAWEGGLVTHYGSTLSRPWLPVPPLGQLVSDYSAAGSRGARRHPAGAFGVCQRRLKIDPFSTVEN